MTWGRSKKQTACAGGLSWFYKTDRGNEFSCRSAVSRYRRGRGIVSAAILLPDPETNSKVSVLN